MKNFYHLEENLFIYLFRLYILYFGPRHEDATRAYIFAYFHSHEIEYVRM